MSKYYWCVDGEVKWCPDCGEHDVEQNELTNGVVIDCVDKTEWFCCRCNCSGIVKRDKSVECKGEDVIPVSELKEDEPPELQWTRETPDLSKLKRGQFVITRDNDFLHWWCVERESFNGDWYVSSIQKVGEEEFQEEFDNHEYYCVISTIKAPPPKPEPKLPPVRVGTCYWLGRKSRIIDLGEGQSLRYKVFSEGDVKEANDIKILKKSVTDIKWE